MKQFIFILPRKFFLLIIRIYQGALSPDHGLLSYRYPGGFCKFDPTCSQFTYQAIEHFGLLRGGVRALKRIWRCNPFSRGGYDPIDFDKSGLIKGKTKK